MNTSNEASLPLEAEQRIDAICLRFEAAWLAGALPRVEDHLGDKADAEQRALLRELLRIDHEFRGKRERREATPVTSGALLGEASTVPPGKDLDSMATTPPLPQQAGDATSATVPGYEILGELGRGGMGVVYKARHLGLGRIVALKMILSGQHADGDAVQRFLAEAKSVAELHHTNVVQLFDSGTHDGLPYFRHYSLMLHHWGAIRGAT